MRSSAPGTASLTAVSESDVCVFSSCGKLRTVKRTMFVLITGTFGDATAA